MDILVVYDSQYGNTERIARTVADTAKTAGTVRLARAGIDASPGIGDVDLLIVGSPTQGWRPTPAMQSFLACIGSDLPPGVAVACFDIRFAKTRWLTGSAARVMAKALRAMGLAPLVPPESFLVAGTDGPLVDGELDRAAGWTHALLAKVDAPQPAAR
jgi:flavodoxin